MKKLLLLIFLLSVLVGMAEAADYYVDATLGDDLSLGTSVAEAWQTISGSLTVSSGDTVYFAKDLTYSDCLTVSADNLTYSSYGTGELPIIYGIRAEEYDNLSISNIEFRRNGGKRAATILGCNGVTFSNCLFDGEDIDHYAQQQLVRVEKKDTTWSENVTFNNCIIRNGGVIQGTNNGGGLCFNFGSRNCTVKNCIIYDNDEVNLQCFSTDNDYRCTEMLFQDTIVYNTDNDITASSFGINLGYRTDDSIIERCYSYNNKQPIAIDANTKRNIVRNCIMENGYWLFRIIANANGDALNNEVYNNTMISTNPDTITGLDIYQTGDAINDGNIIKNNVIYAQNSNFFFMYVYAGVDNLTLDYNCYYTPVTSNNFRWKGTNYTYFNYNNYKAASSQDANSIATAPLLRSDYYPLGNSPLIGAGTPLSTVTDDYNGTARKNPPTIGAYEYAPKMRIN